MMTTYFARHTEKMDIDDDTRKRLWEEKWVAIHYPRDKSGRLPGDLDNELGGKDNASWDLDESSPNAKKSLGVLNKLAEEGGYVCATYAGYDHCLVGYIAANSQRKVMEGKHGSLHDSEGKQALLRGVHLQNVTKIDPREHLNIFVGAPRQTTLTRWVVVKSRIEDLVEGRASVLSMDTLTPAELETLCAEYLRSNEMLKLGLPRLKMLLLPVGRTMKDIDIYGLAEDGTRIIAQVTYGNDKAILRYREEVLRGYRHVSPHLVMFSSYEPGEKHEGIHCCPISTVYDYFKQTPHGKAWMNVAR